MSGPGPGPVVVIGVGNEFRRDDGAGPAVIGQLRDLVPSEVRLVVTDGEPTRLIEAWTGAALAVVVDAVRAQPSHPGRVHRLVMNRPTAGVAWTASSHGLGLDDAIALAVALDRMPGRLIVHAIEAADLTQGTGLTPAAAQAVGVVAAAILDDIGSLWRAPRDLVLCRLSSRHSTLEPENECPRTTEAPDTKEGVTMSNVIHDRSTDHSPDIPAGDDELARLQAIRQIERRRRFWISTVWLAIGMAILVVIWAITEYHNAGGWPVHGFSQSSGIHEVWNFWIVYPLGASLLIVAAHAWSVFGNKPISEAEIKREIERQAGPRP